MELLREFKRTIDEHLHVATLPIAIKFIKTQKDMPEDTGRPLRDLGGPLRPCTAFHLVRHMGNAITLLEEDFSTACPASLFIFGVLDPIKSWIEGDLAYQVYTDTKEAAVNMESSIFRIEKGTYKGVALTPIDRAAFLPDLIMIYCNSKQAMRLVTAATYADGEPLNFSMAARGLCSDGVVQPLQIGRPVVSIPCGGDRLFGVSQDHEIVFTTPFDRLETIIKGLRLFEKTHSIGRLGAETELRKRYNDMAGVLDEKMGRTTPVKAMQSRD